MKKNYGKIAKISAVITAAMFGINMILAYVFGFIIGLPILGGDMMQYIGFGVMLQEFHPLTTIDDVSAGGRSIGLPEPLSLICTFLICMAAGCIIYFARKLIRRIKSKTAERNEA